MEVLALRDQVRPGQGHQVLAADQAADAAVVGLDRLQVGTVAASPDGPLDEGRHHLAAPAQHLAMVVDEEQRVVDRVHRGPRVHLVAADHDDGVGARRGVAQALRCRRSSIIERAVVEPRSHVHPVADARLPAFAPVRIAGDPGFAEDDDLRALARGLLDLRARLVDRLLPVEEDRRGLHDRDLDRGVTIQDLLGGLHRMLPKTGRRMPGRARARAGPLNDGTARAAGPRRTWAGPRREHGGRGHAAAAGQPVQCPAPRLARGERKAAPEGAREVAGVGEAPGQCDVGDGARRLRRILQHVVTAQQALLEDAVREALAFGGEEALQQTQGDALLRRDDRRRQVRDRAATRRSAPWPNAPAFPPSAPAPPPSARLRPAPAPAGRRQCWPAAARRCRASRGRARQGRFAPAGRDGSEVRPGGW